MKLNGISQKKKEYFGLFNKKCPKYPCCISWGKPENGETRFRRGEGYAPFSSGWEIFRIQV